MGDKGRERVVREGVGVGVEIKRRMRDRGWGHEREWVIKGERGW